MSNDETPWENFEHVINPGPGRGYGSEKSFSNALFKAMRTSLDDFCQPNIPKTKWIAFKNSQIRLGKGINRASLGFPEGYALAQDSESDHGCFVMGTIEKKITRPIEKKEEEKIWFSDLTATVKIKLDETSCKSFAHKSNWYLGQPDLRNAHGPLGHALVSTLDVWHCLARRGRAVANLPVVLLAGKSKSIDGDPICCLEAHIEVPTNCRYSFDCSINQIVSFNGTTGLNTNEACTEDKASALRNSRDRRAIAMYIKTMRIGLEHAVEVIKNRNNSSTVSPVSLCCQRLLPEEINVELIASPIIREDHQLQSGLRINQGELFKLVSPTKEMFSVYEPIDWLVDSEVTDIFTETCFIKVSCASVYGSNIHPFICYCALEDLRTECMKNDKLKQELTKVLLGFFFEGSLKSIITIMKDLRAERENFSFLEHEKLRKQGKLPQLWSAFSVLVKSLLLPMADINLIHLDIRSNEEHTYNILVGENPAGCDDSDNAIVLRLIDFESVVKCGRTAGERQDQGVYLKDLFYTEGSGDSWESAHRYLLWQILWIAYTWHPRSPCGSSLTSQEQKSAQLEKSAETFLLSLFDEKYYSGFKDWLGIETVEAIKSSLNAETITGEIIEETLAALKNAFCRKSSSPLEENQISQEQQST